MSVPYLLTRLPGRPGCGAPALQVSVVGEGPEEVTTEFQEERVLVKVEQGEALEVTKKKSEILQWEEPTPPKKIPEPRQ